MEKIPLSGKPLSVSTDKTEGFEQQRLPIAKPFSPRNLDLVMMLSPRDTRTNVRTETDASLNRSTNMSYYGESDLDYPIIVHCHLRWDGVWQRPQQFLSRLARRHRILFIEGPALRDTDELPSAKLNPVQEYPNVTVMQTFFPASHFSDGDWVDNERLRLLNEMLS